MIKKLDYIKKVKVVNDKVIIEANKPEDIEEIMKKTINSDHIIFSIRKIEPSLEETFIDIMGKEN